MANWNDFSDAEEQNGGFDLIPAKTLAKVHLKIRPGGYNDPAQGWNGGYATRSESTGAVYLNCEFTVIGGKFSKRKVFSMIGLFSAKGPEWANMGRSFIRAALESARGIRSDDLTEMGVSARQIKGFGDLDGLEFIAQIDVQKAAEGSQYEDRNVIQNVIGVGHKDYAALMSGQGGSAPSAAHQSPMQSATQKPAWAS